MNTIRDVQQAWQLVLVESATEHGARSGWQQRRGQISPSQFVQTLVWGFLEQPEASVGRLAQVAQTSGATLTPQALSQRFSARSVALLRGVLNDALGLLVEAEAVEVALFAAFPGGVYLDDTTQIGLPAIWRDRWAGAGREAALKLATVFDLARGSVQVELTAGRQHDANLTYPPGAVVIEDLGYLDGPRMQTRQAQGVATVVPVRCTLALCDEQGHRFDWVAWLGEHAGQPVERAVRWQGIPLRLVALPATPATAARKRLGIRAEAGRRQRAPHPRALALADWQVALTTVPPQQATLQQIGVLMRLRWQVELLFKLWKNEGKLDETRGWKAERIETELYAKLLGLLVAHWLVLATGWGWVDRSLVKLGQNVRAFARTLCLCWRHEAVVRQVLAALTQATPTTGRIASTARRRSAADYALHT